MLLASVALPGVCGIVVLVVAVALCVVKKKKTVSRTTIDAEATKRDNKTEGMLSNPLHRKSMGKGLGQKWSIHGVHEPRPDLDQSSLESADSFEAYSSRQVQHAHAKTMHARKAHIPLKLLLCT